MLSLELTGSFAGKMFATPDGAIDAVIDHLQDFETSAIPRTLKNSMQHYLKLIAGRVAARNGHNYPGGTGPRSLSSRSGKAQDSIRRSVRTVIDGNDVVGFIGGIYYLKAHEFGATIRARRSQYLTIPLPAALDSAGVPLKRSARDWTNTFIKRSRKGNLLIFQKRGDQIVPLYVLKKEVTIRKRLGMHDELDNYIGLLHSYVVDGLKKEFRI